MCIRDRGLHLLDVPVRQILQPGPPADWFPPGQRKPDAVPDDAVGALLRLAAPVGAVDAVEYLAAPLPKNRRRAGSQEPDRRRVDCCLLYTSDAADDLLCVDLGGRRIIKKKQRKQKTE